jgi:hypothetical protein
MHPSEGFPFQLLGTPAWVTCSALADGPAKGSSLKQMAGARPQGRGRATACWETSRGRGLSVSRPHCRFRCHQRFRHHYRCHCRLDRRQRQRCHCLHPDWTDPCPSRRYWCCRQAPIRCRGRCYCLAPDRCHSPVRCHCPVQHHCHCCQNLPTRGCRRSSLPCRRCCCWPGHRHSRSFRPWKRQTIPLLERLRQDLHRRIVRPRYRNPSSRLRLPRRCRRRKHSCPSWNQQLQENPPQIALTCRLQRSWYQSRRADPGTMLREPQWIRSSRL